MEGKQLYDEAKSEIYQKQKELFKDYIKELINQKENAEKILQSAMEELDFALETTLENFISRRGG
jgi:L-lactate utilization protein LutB